MNLWNEEFNLKLFFDQYSRDHDDRYFASIVQEHDDAFFELNSISFEEKNVDQTKTQKTDNSNDWYIWSRKIKRLISKNFFFHRSEDLSKILRNQAINEKKAKNHCSSNRFDHYFFDDRKMISCDEFYSSFDRFHSHRSV
jgi:hypothetical protein